MGDSLVQAYQNKYGKLGDDDNIRSVVSKVLSVEYEETTCKAENCIGCKVVYDDCEDAIKHTRNIMKRRLKGEITHAELMRLNEERFGPPKAKLIKHWKQILGAYEEDFKKIINSPSQFDKMTVENQIFHRNVEKQLIYHGWVMPKIENGKLKFTTFHPSGKAIAIEKAEEEDFIPEVEELTQAELPF